MQSNFKSHFVFAGDTLSLTVASMSEEWIKGHEGKNKKFKRETLLNYAANRWALNKASSVDSVAYLIRQCAPNNFEEWENYYYKNAKQKKKDGVRVTNEYIKNLGKRLYLEIFKTVKAELNSIGEDECIDYMYNLVLNRTYEGYLSEIQVIYDELEKELNTHIAQAPDEWDRTFTVDYYIQVKDKFIGLQIKPIEAGMALDNYKWANIQKETHEKFTEKYGGKVFFVYSVKQGDRKVIYNKEVIDEIKKEIKRLSG
jgi:hypothetical protein